MAFDQPTRNRLQRFVTEARAALEEEFTRQLQNDYGMDPASGTVAPLASLRHIDDQQRETARILRDTLAHYCAGADTDTKAGLDRIVREQAFTVLNRLAALRMAEARGLLIESVGNGYQAKGFQLYARLAGTGLGETGDVYRVYLQSVFDELSQDLPGLFDRFSPQGRLFPREAALIQILNLINHGEIEPLWAEDETIGWIYQYFNSKEERKAMREASQAPRNSRELAVRNQFFTPRYVVEFLVDNTLGRLWFNWTGGQTGLRDRCQYLLVKPDTVVLGNMSIEDAASARLAKAIMKGQLSDLPDFDTTDQGVQAMIEFSHCVNGYDRDQSELRGQSLGSAYFDGYRRDLQSGRLDALTTQQIWDGLFFECRADRHGGFGEIYRERWFLAAVQEILARLKGDRERKPELIQKPLKLRDPRTIKLLDPACGSMHFGLYAFDLFLEIYREAWSWEQTHGPGCLDTETGGSADLKPLSQTYADQDAFLHDVPRLIIEHNIYGVDIDPRAAQIASLALWLRAQRAWHEAGVKAKDRPQVGRGHVVAAVAPPAEVDLRKRFMEELDPLDAELFEKTLFMLKGLPELGVLLKVEKDLPTLMRTVFGAIGDLLNTRNRGNTWQQIEMRLREALTEFSRAARATYQGRLFAEDALQSLRMIDLTREQFDAIVMNPPFGALSAGSKVSLVDTYKNSKGDLLAIFVERSLELLRNQGKLGAITSRAPFFLSSMEDWRTEVVFKHGRPEVFADLGMGVMDDAMVEAASYIIEKSDLNDSSNLKCLRALTARDKGPALIDIAQSKNNDAYFEISVSALRMSPGKSFAYWIKEKTLAHLSKLPSLDPEFVSIRVGMQTGNDWRFLRQWWEVQPASLISIDESGVPHEKYESRGEKWITYTKTDKASPWFSPLLQVAKWENQGDEYRNFLNNDGKSRAALRSQELYFKPGFSYMLRSARLVPYIIPAGAIPTAGRAQGFGEGDTLLSALIIASSNIGSSWARLTGEMFERPKFQAGMVQSIPAAQLSHDFIERCGKRIRDIYAERRSYFEKFEPYREFISPQFFFDHEIAHGWSRSSLIGDDLDEAIANEYGLERNEFMQLQKDLQEAISFQETGGTISANDQDIDEDEDEDEDEASETFSEPTVSKKEIFEGLVSYAIGACFGRWDVRNVLEGKKSAGDHDPFKPLPKSPPGSLSWTNANHLNQQGYPLRIQEVGVMDSAAIGPSQLSSRVRECFDVMSAARPIDEEQLCECLGVSDINIYLNRPSGFFAAHLDTYTAGGRKAPIYWPLSTSSGSYTLWLYYPSLTSQTLYTAVNDFVEPKLKQVSRDAATLRDKGAARSRDDEKAFEALQALELELIELRDTLLLIAPTYRPNHDDGVQITAAPLWQMFRHKPWQKILKDTWAKLEKGDYDWAHLAMAYWPDRVREKCKADKSLAIAHDLENLYVEPEAQPKKAGKKRGDA